MNNKPKKPEKDIILYVDDEAENLTGFKFVFRKFYKVYVAQSAKEGIDIMRENQVQLVITDQRMPNVTGIEFLERIASEYPAVTRIILTGFADVEAVIQAINKGRVYRYITKPWSKDELKVTIDNALESYRLKRENRRLIGNLQEVNEKLEKHAQDLEGKVRARTEQVVNQKEEIEKQAAALHLANGEIREINNNLEALVAERTRELTEAMRRLGVANREMETFLYRLSHDLRGPLMTMLGLAQVGKMEVTDPKALEIFEHNENIAGLLDKLLRKFILVTGFSTDFYEVTEINFREIVDGLRKKFHDTTELKRIDFRVNYPEAGQSFYSSEAGLTIILENMLDNAFAYTSEYRNSEVELSFEIKNKQLIIRLKDNGQGIPTDLLENVFEMFFRANEQSKGNGLGLYLVKKTVEHLKGEICLFSEENKYTELRISLADTRTN